MQTIHEIMQTDQRCYMPVFGARTPLAFVRGEGCTLYDSEGKSYTDFFAGIAVNALGYHHPALTQALIDQVQSGVLHTSNLYYDVPQARLAQLLVDNTPFDRVFISNSGAEAIEGALKLARKYAYERGEDRPRVVSAIGSFHGRTLAAVAATGQEKYQAPYKPLLPASIVNIPYNDIEAMRATAGENTCAIVLECIQGEGGIIPAQADYLEQVRALCDEKGILLIFDEIQTGMCRTGKLLCFEHYGVCPDIVTLAKGLGGGVPIGAFLAKEHVAQAFHVGDHGSTFGGNQLVCAGACAVVETMLKENLAQRAHNMGEYLMDTLHSAVDGLAAVREIRGKGLLVGVELAQSLHVGQVVTAMRNKGFIIGSAACNTLRLAPPLIIEKEAINACVAALAQSIQEVHAL